MTQAEHEKRLRSIEAETEEIKRQTEEIKRQMMRFEFQHEKNMAEADRRFQVRHELIDKKIDHLVKLVGLTYDELDEIDATLTETGVVLSRPRKRARIK